MSHVSFLYNNYFPSENATSRKSYPVVSTNKKESKKPQECFART